MVQRYQFAQFGRLFFVIVALFFSSSAFAAVWYVKPASIGGCTPSGTCLGDSWDHAFSNPHHALSAAAAGDVIYVAAGTYAPLQQISTDNNSRSRTFKLKRGVKMYGGFQVDVDFEDRAPYTNITTLTAEIQGDATLSNNAYHVLYAPPGTLSPEENWINNSTVVDGFVITGGNADGQVEVGQDDYDHYSQGGGFYGEGAGPAIVRCKFVDNHANFQVGSLPVIGDGGGMAFNREANCANPDPCAPVAAPLVSNCVFLENTAAGGGGIYNRGTQLTVVNCLFNRNGAAGTSTYPASGGPVCGGALLVRNTQDGHATKVVNCTLVTNVAAADQGGGVCAVDNEFSMYNCILWKNSSAGPSEDEEAQFYRDGVTGSVIANCTIQNLTSAFTGCDASDPNFVDYDGEADDDLHVSCPSTAIDGGSNPDEVPDDVHDLNQNGYDDEEHTPTLDGLLRIRGPIDRGVYEHSVATPCTVAEIVPFACGGNGCVNVDDLLAVINNWGDCDPAPEFCYGDIVGTTTQVDVDDLLAVINSWGCCPNFTDTSGMTFQDVDECLDWCSESFEPYGDKWVECVNACVELFEE